MNTRLLLIAKLGMVGLNANAAPNEIINQLERIRSDPPPAEGFQETNGPSIEVRKKQKNVVMAYLDRLALGLPIASPTDAITLYSYARDENVEIRYIAISALIFYLERNGVEMKARPIQITDSFDDPSYIGIVEQCAAGLRQVAAK
jgi:hypothetical protein